MASHKGHHRNPGQFSVGILRPKPVQEITAPEEKQPRQQGEVIRGVKACRRETQIRRKQVGVQSFRQNQNLCPLKAQPAAAHIAEQQEQAETQCQTCSGGNLCKQVIQRNRQQCGRTQQRQDPPENRGFRHSNQRHRRDQQSTAKGHEPPAQAMSSQMETVAGEKNKCPADSLLPKIGPIGAVPFPVCSKQIHDIPACVIRNHVDQRKTANRIQSMLANSAGSGFHSTPPPRKTFVLS